jgi:predicted nucleic acid-binding protein
LASSTTVPIDRIYEALLSVQEHFRLNIMAYESCLKRAKELIFEFRELKSKWKIGYADFYHLATCIDEGCSLFVTTDERHLLRDECTNALQRIVRILDPDEALSPLH